MWVLGLVIFIDQVDQNILRGVVTPLQHDLGIGDLEIGILLTAYTIVNGVITVPAGYLADRWNRSRTIGHTVVAWSGLTALTAAMPNYGSLLAIRSALGFGQALTEPSAASLIGEVSGLSDGFRQVNEGMRNQAIGAEQINDAMASIASNVRGTATALEEFNKATVHLRGSIEQLNQEIALFRV